jgi:hypothetical protein
MTPLQHGRIVLVLCLVGSAQTVASAQGSSANAQSILATANVIVWYTTAVAAPEGKAWFYSGIYGHDRALDEALRPGPSIPDRPRRTDAGAGVVPSAPATRSISAIGETADTDR